MKRLTVAPLLGLALLVGGAATPARAWMSWPSMGPNTEDREAETELRQQRLQTEQWQQDQRIRDLQDQLDEMREQQRRLAHERREED